MKGRRRYLYGSLGLLSLLGFVGVLTQERVFLLFFAFAVDFGHWFRKNDEMVEDYMNRSAALAFYVGMAATGIIEYVPVWDTELPIRQPPGTALDADAGRALRPPAPQPAPSLYRAYPLHRHPCPATSVLPDGILGV